MNPTATELAEIMRISPKTVWQRYGNGMPRDLPGAVRWVLKNERIPERNKAHLRNQPKRRKRRPKTTDEVVAWCEKHLVLGQAETERHGRFEARPYFREPMEMAADDSVRETVLCTGVQLGKTVSLMAVVAWALANRPANSLWVLPNYTLGTGFTRARFLPLVKSVPQLVAEVAGQRALTNTEMRFKKATLSLVGSNSPANLASRPVRWLICDETDKFADATEREASAIELAKMRTRAYSKPKILLTSTPTIEEGEIWQHYLLGDRRKYMVPCVHCGKRIEFVWSQVQFAEAKREDGQWDKAKALEVARYECQECGGAIDDEAKAKMVKGGVWTPTNDNPAPGVVSYHLSSLYSPDPQCSWGELALHWISGKVSLTGLHGFVNSVLAEPWEEQTGEAAAARVMADDEVPQEGVPLMTVDVQAKNPHFWWVVRRWTDGDSVGVASGNAETWDDLREVQTANKVADHNVFIDAGWDTARVYEHCLAWGAPLNRTMKIPLWRGWTPMMGFDTPKNWRDKQGRARTYTGTSVDPMFGKQGRRRHKTIEMRRVDFSSPNMKDLLDQLRRGAGSIRWDVAESASNDEYWRHMDGEVRVQQLNARTGRSTWIWKRRSHRWPNHLYDCEVMQIAAALIRRLFARKVDDDEVAKQKGAGVSAGSEREVRGADETEGLPDAGREDDAAPGAAVAGAEREAVRAA